MPTRRATDPVELALVSALQARLIVGVVGGLSEADAFSIVAGGPLQDTMQTPVVEASRILFFAAGYIDGDRQPVDP